MKIIPIKRALISVSDKTGLVEFAKSLVDLDVEIISTGGTSKLLKEAGIPHKQVEDITGMPAMLDGRVKTLHPKIHGGILGRREDKHAAEAKKYDIEWIDLVVVNFYPLAEAISSNQNMSWDEAVEFIDVGGPTMVRAAAKNFAFVGVVVDPNDYQQVILQLRNQHELDFDTRRHLAEKAFGLTSRYDAMIQQYFISQRDEMAEHPTNLDLQLEKFAELRYGENPHQKASAYQFKQESTGILSAAQHQGKPLSYNNILDAEAAWTCVSEFHEPACVIVKHANPCGAAMGETIEDAYKQALNADPLSAFGGIIALNRECSADIAEAITNVFMEVVIAPTYTQEALTVLATKPNLRVLEIAGRNDKRLEMRFITGGALMQEKDAHVLTEADLQVVTTAKPDDKDIATMLFAWRVLKHVKSNGILIAKDHATVGIGAGQVSRIDAVDIALRKSGDRLEGTILASDAFFPFRDSIDKLANTGVKVIIQPGGSVRDEDVIAACNEHGIAMVFTGKRCFRH